MPSCSSPFSVRCASGLSGTSSGTSVDQLYNFIDPWIEGSKLCILVDRKVRLG
jgi:hypothetical protein